MSHLCQAAKTCANNISKKRKQCQHSTRTIHLRRYFRIGCDMTYIQAMDEFILWILSLFDSPQALQIIGYQHLLCLCLSSSPFVLGFEGNICQMIFPLKIWSKSRCTRWISCLLEKHFTYCNVILLDWFQVPWITSKT